VYAPNARPKNDKINLAEKVDLIIPSSLGPCELYLICFAEEKLNPYSIIIAVHVANEIDTDKVSKSCAFSNLAATGRNKIGIINLPELAIKR
jgi:hypothetical protein